MSRATLQETLEKYEITPAELLEWEDALGLNIPTGSQGNKLYTRQHINLFKNVKKHLALGRSLDHIKRIISLPPAGASTAVSTDVKEAWGHVPKLTKHAPTPVMEQPAPAAVTPVQAPHAPTLSLQSDALLESFKQDADTLALSVNEDTAERKTLTPIENSVEVPSSDSEAHSNLSISAEAEATAPHVTPIQAPSLERIQQAQHNTPITHAVTPQASQPSSTEIPTSASPTPTSEDVSDLSLPHGLEAISTTQLLQANPLPASTVAHAVHTLHEPSPVHHLGTPMAQASATTSESLQIVDRLITEKDALQHRVVEAEKLNSHLYNINGLFNKKVKELTQLVNTLKKNYNEEDMMKLMGDKSRLQKELLEAERTRLEAIRRSEALKQETELANQACETLKQELHASRTGFNPKRFMGNWKETLTLQEIQFDTFGLNVEPTREQHRLIDSTPTRVVGNVAFITTRYAYPDNDLWQRHETLTLVMLEEHQGKGELQVDYILDGVTVCRAIYAAVLARIS